MCGIFITLRAPFFQTIFKLIPCGVDIGNSCSLNGIITGNNFISEWSLIKIWFYAIFYLQWIVDSPFTVPENFCSKISLYLLRHAAQESRSCIPNNLYLNSILLTVISFTFPYIPLDTIQILPQKWRNYSLWIFPLFTLPK